MTKSICFFGSYNKTHRTHSLMAGLRAHDLVVEECYDNSRKPMKYLRLFAKHWKLRHAYDYLMVGFPGHGLMLLARLITRKPIIFDPFISLYNTTVEDRGHATKWSLKAWRASLLDTWSMRMADIVLADTQAHVEYYVSTFRVSRKKCIVVPVGANDAFMKAYTKNEPRQSDAPFSVRFYGTFSPLQGVSAIVSAAALLRNESDIVFTLLGHGQTLADAKALHATLQVPNLSFVESRVPIDELVQFIQEADVCLGIFGGTAKTKMVVPHKVYDALALGKVVLTADTPAIRTFFTHKENIVVCKDADPEDIARHIVELRDNAALRAHIAHHARAITEARFVPKQIVTNLIDHIA